ncbi:MAG: alpha/beta hydrolase [Bdellovibrionaceae bacterium]|nr:alpha/beta hydrolase [Pseudobdellovibrionaceae bacterium]
MKIEIPKMQCLFVLFGILTTLTLPSPAKADRLALMCNQLFAKDFFASSAEAGPPALPPVLEWQVPTRPQRGVHLLPRHRGIISLRSGLSAGQKLYYELTLPTTRLLQGEAISYNGSSQKPMALLLHGVADKMQDLEKLRRQFESIGWGVAMVDFIGHGRSAEVTPDQNGEIKASHQIDAVVQLIQALKLKNFIILGHSMGGGHSMSIAREIKARGLAPLANIPIAPYLSAIDKFVLERAMTPDMLTYLVKKQVKGSPLGQLNEMREDQIEAMGLRHADQPTLASIYYQFWTDLLQALLEPQVTAYDATVGRMNRTLLDLLSDPITRKMMHDMYTKYETLKNNARPEQERETEEQIRLHVRGAIEATVGMSELDYLSRTKPTQLDPTIPTLLISGSKDPVVLVPQVQDFQHVVNARRYDVTFVEFDNDHFIPQQKPDEVVRLITDFLLNRQLIHELDKGK